MSFTKVIEQAYSFKDILEKDERVLNLLQCDQAINKNQTLIQLVEAYQLAQRNYESVWQNFGDESDLVQQARHHLHQVKTSVDTEPSVQQYLKAYAEVRKIYQHIQEEIFLSFKSHPLGCKT
jgi:cell fate (sporulation/competence/biofilm development) regulator YlbF (YheA/YmcA/DUF963 family)